MVGVLGQGRERRVCSGDPPPTSLPAPWSRWARLTPPLPLSVCRNGRLSCIQVKLIGQGKWPPPRAWPPAPHTAPLPA